MFMLDEQIMSNIVNAQDQNLLPALESLCVNHFDEKSVFDINETHRLRKVSVHDAESFGDDFSPWGCICCEDGRVNNAPVKHQCDTVCFKVSLFVSPVLLFQTLENINQVHVYVAQN